MDKRLVELLIEAEEWRQQGRAVTAEDLCPESPELWPSLREYLHRFDRMDQGLPIPSGCADSTEPPSTGAAPAGPAASLPAIPGYQVLREIGRGGMGVVYQAVEQALGRDVALKILPWSSVGTGSHLERFKLEARAAARTRGRTTSPCSTSRARAWT
jgi:serine/threonine protein kinase